MSNATTKDSKERKMIKLVQSVASAGAIRGFPYWSLNTYEAYLSGRGAWRYRLIARSPKHRSMNACMVHRDHRIPFAPMVRQFSPVLYEGDSDVTTGRT